MAAWLPLLLAFGFTSPLLLWGLLLAAAPVLIHLFHRRRYREESWGAMRFLRAAVQKQSSRLRLESLLLLIVRMLIVLFVALAMAQPHMETFSTFFQADGPRHQILVVDASASMGDQPDGERRFDAARRMARTIVEGGRPGDAFNLLRIAGSPPYAIIRRPAFDARDVLHEIEQIALSDERGDVLATLRETAALLRQVADLPDKEVYFLSDFQRDNWLPEDAAARSQVRQLLEQIGGAARLHLVDVGQASTGNVAVTGVELRAPFAFPGEPATVRAVFRNFGRTPVQQLPVELSIDGRVRQSQRVDLPASGEVAIELPAMVETVREAAIEVRIGEDGLPVDNRRSLVLPVRDRLQLLLVNGRTSLDRGGRATDFLEVALAPQAVGNPSGTIPPEGHLQPRTIDEAEIATHDLARYDVVFLCDVPQLSSGEIARLEAWVRGGGGLVVSLGDAVRVDQYNDGLFRDGRGLLPARLLDPQGDPETIESPFRFDPGDFTHPIVEPFSGNDEAGLKTTHLYRYFGLEVPDDSAARVALRFSTGDPAIVEQRFGLGRVILIATSLDDRWGNWALWPSFVPMMHETVYHAAAGVWENRQLLVGQPIERILPVRAFDLTATLTLPDGRAAPVTPACTESECLLSYAGTEKSGVYSLQFGPPFNRTERIAVNLDPRESDLTPVDAATLQGELLAGVQHTFGSELIPGGGEAESIAVERGGLSRWLLTAALCLLLVELVMSWKFLYGFVALYGAVAIALVAQSWQHHPVAAAALGAALIAGGVLAARRAAHARK